MCIIKKLGFPLKNTSQMYRGKNSGFELLWFSLAKLDVF